jgi:DNA-binding transcriptional MerR regulator
MTYSISDLEQLSGVSVHNIRIWERRYAALTPSRTSGNVRYYDDDQLKKLLGITGLYHTGYKISKACRLSSEEMQVLLREEIKDTIPPEQKHAYFISRIIDSAMIFDESAVNDLIAESFKRNGVLETYKSVIYPMLVRVGLMWLGESLCPAQEHFLSAIIRQKLFAEIDRCITGQAVAGSSWLLFLPEDEDHDMGLLLASYLLRTAGHKVTYLGPRVPFQALGKTVAGTQPKQLLFFMTRLRPVADAQAYVDKLVASFPGIKIYLSGNKRVISDIRLPEQVCWLETLPDFECIINENNKG